MSMRQLIRHWLKSPIIWGIVVLIALLVIRNVFHRDLTMAIVLTVLWIIAWIGAGLDQHKRDSDEHSRHLNRQGRY